MDNFDIRKYITEAKLSEQKKAYIKYEDGSTEDRMFHQSVSDSKIKKMFAPGTFIDGKKVLKVLVGDSLDQPINEAEEGYNEILQWAEENLNFELSPRMLDDIKNILDDGVPVKVIKKMLSDPTGSRLNEEKDVLDPEEGAEDKKKEDLPFDYDEEKVEAIIPSMEKKLAIAIYSAYNPDEGSEIEAPSIDQNYILSMVKKIRDDKDFYYQTIHDLGEKGALQDIADEISLDYLKKFVDKEDIKETYQLTPAYDELDKIFEDFTDYQYPAGIIGVYVKNR